MELHNTIDWTQVITLCYGHEISPSQGLWAQAKVYGKENQERGHMASVHAVAQSRILGRCKKKNQ
jgi:hypothetical protein